jgi:hypothetical protein
VSGLSGVAEVASGAQYSCARRAGIDVLCWGSNPNGAQTDTPTPLVW